jgi:17beta-estradiol 17-dehydrogenase / very-long-chain 3-oxoacyl-CoA reductase
MPCVKVNNVGMAGQHMMRFLDQDENAVMNMINVNLSTCTVLTHAFLPSMRGKGRGAIINISSVARMQPMPFIAVYAATKHYIHAFTEALAYENKDSGFVFQEVTPWAVETTLTKHLPRDRFRSRAQPSEFVNSALSTLGYSSRTCGWWPHSAQLLVFQSLPDVVGRWAIWKGLEYKYRQIMRNMEKKKSA